MCKDNVGYITQTNKHPFNGVFFRDSMVILHRKGKAILDVNEQKMMGWEWHQMDCMQIICTSLQTDNHTSTPSLKFLQFGFFS